MQLIPITMMVTLGSPSRLLISTPAAPRFLSSVVPKPSPANDSPAAAAAAAAASAASATVKRDVEATGQNNPWKMVSPALQETIRALKWPHPTRIQKITIPLALSNLNVIPPHSSSPVPAFAPVSASVCECVCGGKPGFQNGPRVSLDSMKLKWQWRSQAP